MMTVPCKDCEDRRAGCHGACQKYQAFAAERSAWREQQLAAQDVTDYTIKQIRRTQKQMRVKGR